MFKSNKDFEAGRFLSSKDGSLGVYKIKKSRVFHDDIKIQQHLFLFSILINTRKLYSVLHSSSEPPKGTKTKLGTQKYNHYISSKINRISFLKSSKYSNNIYI